jgi:hypothetical protein
MSAPKDKPRVQPAAKTTAPTATPKYQPQEFFVFERINYIIMAAGIALMLIGYFIMVGGGTDPNHPEIFNAAEKYSFTRITLAPILILLGLVVEIVAIMYKPKEA